MTVKRICNVMPSGSAKQREMKLASTQQLISTADRLLHLFSGSVELLFP